MKLAVSQAPCRKSAATTMSLKTFKTCCTFYSWSLDGQTAEHVKGVVFKMLYFSALYRFFTSEKEATDSLSRDSF
jgi:hypothetical protein